MKKIYLFLLLFGCLLSTSTMGEVIVNKSNDEEKISLKGDFPANILRSSIKPVQAFIINQSVEVDFNAALGTVVISIYDETGSTVYQQSVNAYAGQWLFIDISSLEEGEYTIEFVNSQGKYLSGDFEI